MKITCLIASLGLGGAERQLVGLATLLKKSGEDVDVLTYREGDFYGRELRDAGIRHTRIDPSGGDFKIVKRIAAHLQQNGTQVVISFLVGANIKACMAHMIYKGFKLVVSERNCNTTLLPHDIFRFTLYDLEADSVVCNSFAQTAFLIRHCPGLRLRLETISNFVDIEKYSSIERDAPADGKIKVVTVARLSPRKNATGLIKAAADPSLENLRFDWYGSGKHRSYEQRCRRLISRLGLEDRFSIHPASDNPAALYACADAFCLCSWYEGTPNSLAEALSSGLPAVCSEVSDNARYVVPGRNGFLFTPRDSRSIAKALRKLTALSPEELKAAGESSRAIAAENFPKDLFIKRYLDLLRGLTGGQKGKNKDF